MRLALRSMGQVTSASPASGARLESVTLLGGEAQPDAAGLLVGQQGRLADAVLERRRS